nr:histidine kinase [Actinocatenispora rupis]
MGAAVWYAPLALLLLVGSLVPSLHNFGTQLGGVPAHPYDAVALVAIGVQCLPLVVRRRWPVWCLALVSVGFAVDQLRGYHTMAGTALPIALVAVGANAGRLRRTTALAFSLAYAGLAVTLARVGPGESVSGYVMFYLACALAWGIGTWWRATRAAEAERRSRVAEATRTAERTRIARELHDVVTHHVTAMVVQAEAAQYLTGAPERLSETLTAVTDTGRRAITDLRHLLDLLDPGHDGDARTPPAGRLRTLVDQTRRAGQPVEFTERGTPAESAGSADLVAYRVVQEALTNALKHARGSRTEVLVHHGEREISVEVATDGAGARPAVPAGGGRGLAGLRDRVDVLGGDFTADGRPDGGFVVRARIPAGKVS